jgi:putative membrane protein
MALNKNIRKLIPAALTCSLVFSVPAIAQDKPRLSDAEVAYVAVVANQIDISYAEIAKEKSKDPEVIKFAETMERDHKAVIAKAAALAKRLGVTPKENAVSQSLLNNAEKTKKTLRGQSSLAFDRTYIDNEVAYHKAVIEAVEGLLIPETENAELKQLLQNVVPALKAHLMHAEMLQKTYSK